MSPDLFTLIPPTKSAKRQRDIPIIANIPHSGLAVPHAIADQFTEQHLRTLPNSDWHLQTLYSFLPSLGITVLQANYSRYVVDLNRALTPPLFGSFWSAVVPERTAFNQPIYRQGCLPSKQQVRSRIESYYKPYHQKLTALLNDAIAEFGKVYLLDLHSFMGLITDDVCLGNAKGTTCTEETINAVAESFARADYGVVKNKVFTGGYITRHYGYQSNIEALQIELRYPTYLPLNQIGESDRAEQPSDSLAGSSAVPPSIPSYQSEIFTQAQSKLRKVFSQI